MSSVIVTALLVVLFLAGLFVVWRVGLLAIRALTRAGGER